MSVNAIKCDYATLKYEQLLSEKYMVETCFTKKYDSYKSHDQLIDKMFAVKANLCKLISNNEESK